MLSRKASASGWTLGNIEYGQDVVFDIIVPQEAGDEAVRYCLDLTGGALELKDPESLFMQGAKTDIS